MWFSVYVIVTLSLVAPLLTFEWTKEPQSKEVKRGETVVLQCAVSGEYMWISWQGKTARRESGPLFEWPYGGGNVMDKVFDPSNFKIVDNTFNSTHTTFNLQLLVSRRMIL